MRLFKLFFIFAMASALGEEQGTQVRRNGLPYNVIERR
jgi:hypothetical protein